MRQSRGDDQLVLGELIDCLVEAMRQRRGVEQEPFELYADQLKSRLQSDIDDFKSRFIKGYEGLMEVLEAIHSEE